MIRLLFIIFLFLSCDHEDSGNNSIRGVDSTSIKEINAPQQITFTTDHLKEKVFSEGASYHFTDSCDFNFECDCCAGNLVFNADLTFYYTFKCIGDETFCPGNYEIKADRLLLHYNGSVITKEYNWENDIDSTSIDFFWKDTIIDPWTNKYFIQLCNKKIKLIDDKKENVGIETGQGYAQKIEYIYEFRKLMELRDINH